MKRLRTLVLALAVSTLLAASARPAVASDDFARNVLIGALIGAGVGAIVGLVVYLSKDKPAPTPTAARTPPSWASVGLGPLPARPAPPPAPSLAQGVLLRF